MSSQQVPWWRLGCGCNQQFPPEGSVGKMGAGKSKQFPITYEEACKRGKMKKNNNPLQKGEISFLLSHFSFLVSHDVLTRLEETFKRMSTASGYLPLVTFTRDIFGDTVPPKLAEVRQPLNPFPLTHVTLSRCTLCTYMHRWCLVSFPGYFSPRRGKT